MAKRIVVVAIFGVIWAGSVWIAYWAGFTHQLSIATYDTTLAYRVQLRDEKMLLGEIDAGNVDAVRQKLEGRIRLSEELVKLHEDLPEIGPVDILLAGFHPRELIDLARTAKASKGRETSSLRPSGKPQ